MIQWNPIFVLINIIEPILLVNSWFFLFFSTASDLWKISRLNIFSEHARPFILSQEEVLIELEYIITISVLHDFSYEFYSQPVNKSSYYIVHDVIVCVTTSCQVKDEWKRSSPKDNSIIKLGTGTLKTSPEDSLSGLNVTLWIVRSALRAFDVFFFSKFGLVFPLSSI